MIMHKVATAEEIGGDIRKTVDKMKKKTQGASSVYSGSILGANDGTVGSTEGTAGEKSVYDISKAIHAPNDSSFFKEMDAPPKAKSLSASGRTLSHSSTFTMSTVGSSLFEMGNFQPSTEDSINEECSEDTGDDTNTTNSPFSQNFWRNISNLFCEKVVCSPDGLEDAFTRTALQSTKEEEFDDGYLSSLGRRVSKMNRQKLSHNPIYHGPTEDEGDVASLDDSLLREDGAENFFTSLWSNTWDLRGNDETVVTLDTVPSALTGTSSTSDSTAVSSEA